MAAGSYGLSDPGPEPKRAVVWRGCGDVQGDGLEQVYPRSAMDLLRDVWMSQDRKPEEHTIACQWAMVVMD